jgi:hypothetical protein
MVPDLCSEGFIMTTDGLRDASAFWRMDETANMG